MAKKTLILILLIIFLIPIIKSDRADEKVEFFKSEGYKKVKKIDSDRIEVNGEEIFVTKRGNLAIPEVKIRKVEETEIAVPDTERTEVIFIDKNKLLINSDIIYDIINKKIYMLKKPKYIYTEPYWERNLDIGISLRNNKKIIFFEYEIVGKGENARWEVKKDKIIIYDIDNIKNDEIQYEEKKGDFKEVVENSFTYGCSYLTFVNKCKYNENPNHFYIHIGRRNGTGIIKRYDLESNTIYELTEEEYKECMEEYFKAPLNGEIGEYHQPSLIYLKESGTRWIKDGRYGKGGLYKKDEKTGKDVRIFDYSSEAFWCPDEKHRLAKVLTGYDENRRIYFVVLDEEAKNNKKIAYYCSGVEPLCLSWDRKMLVIKEYKERPVEGTMRTRWQDEIVILHFEEPIY